MNIALTMKIFFDESRILNCYSCLNHILNMDCGVDACKRRTEAAHILEEALGPNSWGPKDQNTHSEVLTVGPRL